MNRRSAKQEHFPPALVPGADILALQSQAGNAAVTRALNASSPLTVSREPGPGKNATSRLASVPNPGFAPTVTPKIPLTTRPAEVKRLGVGEEATLDCKAARQLTGAEYKDFVWRKTAGKGFLEPTSFGKAVYTASGTPGSAHFSLVRRGRPDDVPLTEISIQVVAPAEVHFIRLDDDVTHFPKTWSVGFTADVTLKPEDVCFSAIEVREDKVPLHMSGWIEQHWSDKIRNPEYAKGPKPTIHEQGPWRSVNKLKLVDTNDIIFSGLLERPLWPPTYGNGDLSIYIPWRYRIVSFGDEGEVFAIVRQAATSSLSGMATIEKGDSGKVAAEED